MRRWLDLENNYVIWLLISVLRKLGVEVIDEDEEEEDSDEEGSEEESEMGEEELEDREELFEEDMVIDDERVD